MFDLTSRRFWYFLISAIIIIPGIISLAVFGLKPGIEFSSGSTMTLCFEQTVEQGELRQELANLGYPEAIIQGTHKEGFLVKARPLTSEEVRAVEEAFENEYGSPAFFFYSTEASGETALTIVFAHHVEQAEVEGILAGLGYGEAPIEPIQKQAFLMRTRTLSQEPAKPEEGKTAGSSEMQQLESALESRFGSFGLFDFYSVSPVVASKVVRNAAIAVVAAAAAILPYISWAFRRMPKPFRYGTCAIIAMVHDVLVVLGIFSILGWVSGMEVDAMFITGILTVVGYSVHDTIVVFDRIRENVSKSISRDFETTVNSSLLETMGRSLNTSLTTLLPLFALYLFGGVTIHNFVLVMLIGIITGTYSSIFNASQLLVVWEKKEWGRFLAWVPGRARS